MSSWWLMSNPFMHLSWKMIRHCLGRWDVLFLSTNLLPFSSISGFLLPLSESSKSPWPIIRGRAPRASKHFPAWVLNFFQTVPGLWAALHSLPSASLGFCFSGMAASILEVGNVIVSTFFFLHFSFIQNQLLWFNCCWNSSQSLNIKV